MLKITDQSMRYYFLWSFERMIHDRLFKVLKRINLNFARQYEFIKKRSTLDAILTFGDHCYIALLDPKVSYCLFFSDLSKAFDAIDHCNLCKKIECYGLRGVINHWIRSYLSTRSQLVLIDGSQSNPTLVLYGVLQGSIPYPLLFLLYKNDMYRVTNLNRIPFVGDSTYL